jgi:hypothetical protein
MPSQVAGQVPGGRNDGIRQRETHITHASQNNGFDDQTSARLVLTQLATPFVDIAVAGSHCFAAW